MKNPTPQQRRYLYRVGVALVGVLIAAGILDSATGIAIGVLLAAILGLADYNVDTSEQSDDVN